jgi:hypothetical protein
MFASNAAAILLGLVRFERRGLIIQDYKEATMLILVSISPPPK